MDLDENPRAILPYLGIPYLDMGQTREGSDCWGLVKLFLQEVAGIALPAFSERGTTTPKEELHRVAAMSDEWSVAERPFQQFDVLVFIIASRLHVGVVIGEGIMLQAAKVTGSIVVDLRREAWGRMLVDGYRHQSC